MYVDKEMGQNSRKYLRLGFYGSANYFTASLAESAISSSIMIGQELPCMRLDVRVGCSFLSVFQQIQDS